MKQKKSGFYRCHDLNEEDFIGNLKTGLKINKNLDSHVVIGDANLNIFKLEGCAEEYFYLMSQLTTGLHIINKLSNKS